MENYCFWIFSIIFQTDTELGFMNANWLKKTIIDPVVSREKVMVTLPINTLFLREGLMFRFDVIC